MTQTSYRYVRLAPRTESVKDARSKQLAQARAWAARNGIHVPDADPLATKPAPPARREDRP